MAGEPLTGAAAAGSPPPPRAASGGDEDSDSSEAPAGGARAVNNGVDGMCPFYLRRVGCRKGAACPLKHTPFEERPVCADYATKRACHRGDTCWYRHVYTPVVHEGNLLVQVRRDAR